jgi:protein-disulfide isomerase
MFLKSFGAALAALALAAACGPTGRANIVNVEGDAYLGPADAKVTVIEYGSPTCPGCKAWHDAFLEEVTQDYITPGKIKFVFREYAIHGAIDAAIFSIARCSGTEDYFKVLDEAFATQGDIVGAASSGNALPALEKLGEKFQLTPAQVKSCMNDPANVKRINEVGAYTKQIGVNSTPTFFVDGVQIEDSNWRSVKAAVDAALSGQPVVPAPIVAPADALAPADGGESAPGEQH